MKERAMVPKAEFRSYYGRPVLKQPVWRWQIPAYFFAGGLAAGSSVLAAGGMLTGRARLARRSRLTALAAIAASTAFLVDDLGRPERFHHMLRVFKPTSPMSMGSWLLAVYGPAVGAAAASDVTGLLPGVGGLATVSAAALAPAVATYTAVIVADTAVPAWHQSHSVLPFVFASGAAASAGGMACALAPAAESGPARRLALLGAAAELAAVSRLDHHAYEEGKAGRLGRLSKALTAGGAALLAVGGRRRSARVVGGLGVAVGAALERFAVAAAGDQSALDPADTVVPQRARLGFGDAETAYAVSASPKPGDGA